MPKYAVIRGDKSYVVDSWDQAKQHTHGVSNSYCKKFDSTGDAMQYIQLVSDNRSSGSAGPQSSSVSRSYSSGGAGTSRSQIDFVSSSTSYGFGYVGSSRNYSSGSGGGSKKVPGLSYDSDGYLKVYTDGSCTSNGGANAKAGIGIYFSDNSVHNVAEPVKGPATNNNAEIQAARKAIDIANDLGVKKVRIYTDSQFTINSVTDWMPNWKQNGWKTSTGESVKNREQLELLDKAMQNMEHVDWKHVRGHQDTAENIMADNLARKGAERYNNTAAK